MGVFRNTMMLVINGLIVVFYGLVHDKVMRFFGVTSTTAQIIVIVGIIIAFLPMLIRPEVYDRPSTKEKGFLFWKRLEVTRTTVRVTRLFGLIPIKEEVLESVTTSNGPSFREAANEVAETLVSLIPVFGPLASLPFAAKKPKRLPRW
ncbi:MAG: hypothetical protein LBD48_06440 [Treponema sp.]|jgi:hypothetical protein|nr:hypothetical protein [Treponema sp.]